MLLKNVDEYSQWSIPPEEPVKQSSLEIIRQHAAVNPKLRSVLDRLQRRTDSLRIRSYVDYALERGTPVTPITQKLLSSRQNHIQSREQVEASQDRIDRLSETLTNLSNERESMLRQLEESKHQSLLIHAICNNISYKTARLEAYHEAVESLKKSEVADRQECERMLNAAQFDLESCGDVEIQRILTHRGSIADAIEDIEERDIATINHLLDTPNVPDDDADALADALIRMKSQVLENMCRYKVNQEQIEELKANMTLPVSKAAETHALQSVHLQLLAILDDLVPKTFDDNQPKETSVLTKSIDATKQRKTAYDSIALLKGAFQQEESLLVIDEEQVSSLLDELKSSLTLTATLPKKIRSNIVRIPKGKTSTTSIINKARSLHNLKVKMLNSRMNSEHANLQSTKAISEAESHATLHRKSIESPLLATREIGDSNVSELTTAWYEESLRRSEFKEAEILKRSEVVQNKLDKIMESLKDQQQLYHDVKSLQRE